MAREVDKLQRSIEELIAAQPDDQRLRDHLEGLTRDEAFPGLTWSWGPRLYQRNRVLFRPLILNNFSTWATSGRRWTSVRWRDHAEPLERWLTEARAHRDTALVRRLLDWKHSDGPRSTIVQRWNAALLDAYRQAGSPAARIVVLDEFDSWHPLDEASAVQLYRVDPASAAFILKHLPRTWWNADKRKPWRGLAAEAREAGDTELLDQLYRRQTPVADWQNDVLARAEAISDPDLLDSELERLHLIGYSLPLDKGLLALLKLRGREVLPYVQRKLPDVVSGWSGKDTKPFVDFAAERGWWDFWAAAVRLHRDGKTFNKAVAALVRDDALSEETRRERLASLAGVSREFNWGGFGFAQAHPLEDAVAVQLYAWAPDLVLGPFLPNVLPRWWSGGPKLLEAALAAEDVELIDRLASRYLTWVHYPHPGQRKRQDAMLEAAERLADYYEAIRARDEIAFAERAANVLTRVPAFSVFSYHDLLRRNRLARLLFVRSFAALPASPRAVQDLVEASDIHVQMLAYRVLAQDDPRAREQAVANLDILLGTLLRPLHRKTRLPAFAALASAAADDSAAAARVLARAEDALTLPDKRYPKEQLLGLIGRIKHAHPELRAAGEEPVVYGLAGAAS